MASESGTANGNCNTWAQGLKRAAQIHNIKADLTRIIVKKSDQERVFWFFVANWQFKAPPPFPDGAPFFPDCKWDVGSLAVDPSMGPPFETVFGSIKSTAGLPGQNSATPSQKVFTNHRVVRYGALYYDPSYGVSYLNIADFAATVVSGYVIDATIQGGPDTVRAEEEAGQEYLEFE